MCEHLALHFNKPFSADFSLHGFRCRGLGAHGENHRNSNPWVVYKRDLTVRII
jgi:hypothetical protein